MACAILNVRPQDQEHDVPTPGDEDEMRIAINGDYLAEPQTGTGRYLTQLIETLGQIDGVNEYLILHYRPIAQPPQVPSTFAWEHIPVVAPSDALRKVRWEQRTIPEAARRRDARLIFVPHFAPPVMTTLPVVTTIHDVIPFALSDYRPHSALWAYYQLVAQGARRAAMVITVSDHAKSEIMRYLNVAAEKIVVTPPAPAPIFRPVTDPARIHGTLRRHGISERFVFYVGGLDLRKQVPLLVGAFASAVHRLGDPHVQLVISGDIARLGSDPLFPDWRPLARKLGIETRIVSDFIPDEDLPTLYSAATVFAYPSLYEGFGLPPLEAMACGAPVVVSDHPAVLEATGNAALAYALPRAGSPPAEATRPLADALTRALQSAELREDLRQRSLARARAFSWAQVAAETSGIFTEIIGTRN